MAKDDMHLIIYKILRYLYDCNKKGKTPLFSELFTVAELVTIPSSYLGQIIEELIDCGYINGCTILVTKDATHITLTEKARITIKGVEFLTENSRMKKAAKVAGTAFEIMLEGVLAVL